MEITLRGKILPALVIKNEDIKSQKLAIKRGAYNLKKVRSVSAPPGRIPVAVIKLCENLSRYYIAPIGQTLKLFIPSAIASAKDFPTTPSHERGMLNHKETAECVIGSLQERIQHYKTIIRQALANEKNICIFTPTINIAEFIHSALSDLPRPPTLIHGGLARGALVRAALVYKNNKSASCLVATPVALSILNGEEIIILEDADSAHYQRSDTPILNYREAIRLYCELTNSRFVLGKYFQSLGDLLNQTSVHYISSRIKPQKQFIITAAPPLSKTLIGDGVKSILEQNKKTLVFVSRKGYFTFVLCNNCSNTLECKNCGALLIMSASKDKNYQCNKCLQTYASDLACSHCGGWDLKGYGIGTGHVHELIKNLFSDRPIWLFDEASLKTTKERKTLVDLFNRSQNGVLVGTDLLLEESGIIADLATVLSIDNLFSIPDLTISARIFTILCKLKDKAPEEPAVIQTRFPDHPIFLRTSNQDIKGHLTEELEERKREHLPPYTLAIKLTIDEKNKERRESKVAEISRRLGKFKDLTSSYPVLGDPSRHIVLLVVEKRAWQANQDNLVSVVESCLDIAASIAVDPESIL